MAGNIWQWCQDTYDMDYWRQQSDITLDPVNASGSDEADRVLRGGSWLNNGEDFFRSSSRGSYRPTLSGNVIGFRCVFLADDH